MLAFLDRKQDEQSIFMDQKLANSIAELREKLKEAKLDDKAHEELAALLVDAEQSHHEATITERIEAMILRLEAEHPHLADTLNQILNTLSSMGI